MSGSDDDDAGAAGSVRITAPKRYSNFDGEASGCYMVGQSGDAGSRVLVVALPYVAEEHQGMWDPVTVRSSEGELVRLESRRCH